MKYQVFQKGEKAFYHIFTVEGSVLAVSPDGSIIITENGQTVFAGHNSTCMVVAEKNVAFPPSLGF